MDFQGNIKFRGKELYKNNVSHINEKKRKIVFFETGYKMIKCFFKLQNSNSAWNEFLWYSKQYNDNGKI